ncbi:hypothetical protein SAMN04487857_11584 [Pseudomonas sp. ok272]|uniref:hypothetical protein n=1 Tax=unclassified Pseudomonas TaxID=196821 RepID=UPI0008BC44A0|nr:MULTISPECIES: hypothetical protein [unclassified Pseudomonas]SEN39588.1 hypothetical protein SAMN04487857_11584 [Pseudomonas sp. ok272]SFN23436.1 hypothetical protein SAMN04487858_11584 [Pseudomonas sp. ok602]
MLVSTASLRQPTFKVPNHRRRALEQSVVDYVKSECEVRAEYVRRKIMIAAKAAREDHDGSDCLFFTLPEFFWNVPWREVVTEDELHQLNAAYLEYVPTYVMGLVKDLPFERYGKIVLLAGSCATLIKVGEGDASYYDVINYLLAITNKEYENDVPLMSMWPKRNVSGIDFGKHVGFEEGYWFFNLSEGLTVKVKKLSNVRAEHSYFGGYEALFVNSLVMGCPFGINLCLDYAVLEEGERDQEIELSGVKVDFLIACGMDVDYGKLHPSSVQYIVRNDGMGEGECEVVKLEAGRIVGVVPSVVIDDNLYLTPLNID